LFPCSGMGWHRVFGGRCRLEIQYGGVGVKIEWGFMLMMDSEQGHLLGMSECSIAKRMLF
jgi:hypothetical protein